MFDKLLNQKAVILALKARTKAEALKEIAKHLTKHKFVDNAINFEQDLKAREKQFSTGIGNEIAIPHAQSKAVKKNVILVAKSAQGISWGSPDQKKVKYLFAIALNAQDTHLQVETLQKLSQVLLDEQTKVNLAKAKSSNALLNALLIKPKVVNKPLVKGAKKIVAVTACPTGIAHTYLAQEALEKAGAKLNYDMKVETQGRTIKNKLSQKDIDEADAIILAIDKGIDGMERFSGKRVLKVNTKLVIKDASKEIERSLQKQGEVIKSISGNSLKADEDMGDYSWSAFKNIYKNLMGGVSRMLPFVVAGGIILGIAFLLDSGNSGNNLGVTRDVARWFSGLGKISLNIFVPILGAYVAYSIVGAEGLLPGMIAGLIASGGSLLYGGDAQGWSNLWGGLTPGIDQNILLTGSGFIGAMVGGYIAAAAVTLLRKYIFIKVAKNFRGIIDIVAMPVLSVLLTGMVMFVVQIPLAYFAYGLKRGLKSLADRNLLILVTMFIGLMMAFDMGGPVNKVAYVFGTSLIGAANPSESDYIIMGAVMITGMTPPLGIAFSNLVFRTKAWTNNDMQASKVNWLLGAFFITEGAIPFAAKDPKRTIPSLMIGSAVAGLLVGLFKVGVSAPHGGIVVASLYKSFLFSSDGLQIAMGITFLLTSLTAGMMSTGLILGFWRYIDVKRHKLTLV